MAHLVEYQQENLSVQLNRCLLDKDVHNLMIVLRNHPVLESTEKKSIKALLAKSPKKDDSVKIIKKYYEKGLEKAESQYRKKYGEGRKDNHPEEILRSRKQKEPVATTEDAQIEAIGYKSIGSIYRSDNTLPSASNIENDYITETEQFLLQNTSEKKKAYDEETIYEEINIDDVKEKEVANCVNVVEETTKEIKKGVQHANVSIENSFSDLQQMVEQMSRKTAMTMENMQKQMSQLQQAIIDVQEEMKRNTEAINSGVIQLLSNTDQLRSNVHQGEEFNEYIYYMVFTLVSRAIGNRKGKWLELFFRLLDGHPEIFIQRVVWEIRMKHPSEVDMTYDCLTRWKVYDNSKERLPILTKTLNEMGLSYLVKQINNILSEYSDETEKDISETIKNDVLNNISKELGDEYATLSSYLDIGPTRMNELEVLYENNAAERNYAMLTEWRDKQECYASTSLAKLSAALNYTNRKDLVETLAKGVEKQITLPSTQEDYNDDYLTPISLNLP